MGYDARECGVKVSRSGRSFVLYTFLVGADAKETFSLKEQMTSESWADYGYW